MKPSPFCSSEHTTAFSFLDKIFYPLGFTLTEVLVSLFFVAGFSLTLLKYQYQIPKLYNQVRERFEAMNQFNNNAEVEHA